MKGYKGTHNGYCRGMKFEVGKTYEFNGDIKLCKKGFHYCKRKKDVEKYYFEKGTKIFLIEDIGSQRKSGDNKTVTNKIKIIKEVNFVSKSTSSVTINQNGNVTHYKNINGYEWWKEYDKNGNETHYKNINGDENWKEYDENGNITHYKNINGDEWWKEYDKSGNITHYKNINGYEYWSEYDENGNETHYKSSNGYEY